MEYILLGKIVFNTNKRANSLWNSSVFIFVFLDWLMGEHGGCSDESTRLSPMWPGFESRTRRHTWHVEFIVGSRPFSEGFSTKTNGPTTF